MNRPVEVGCTVFSRAAERVVSRAALRGSARNGGRLRIMGANDTMSATLEVVVNGEPARTRSKTLAELLVELGYGDAKVATARNGDFVPLRKRDTIELSSGDAIEIVSPRQGG